MPEGACKDVPVWNTYKKLYPMPHNFHTQDIRTIDNLNEETSSLALVQPAVVTNVTAQVAAGAVLHHYKTTVGLINDLEQADDVWVRQCLENPHLHDPG